MNILVSFVHGYQDENVKVITSGLPCIVKLCVATKAIVQIYRLPFPRTPSDFNSPLISEMIRGESPLSSQELEFKRLPRFGVMGLVRDKNEVFAATWNGIWSLNQESLLPNYFITHRLINDPHGIAVKEDSIFSIVTALDLVVETDKRSGRILDYFSVDRSLNIIRDPSVLEFDWRFISKQERGAVGNWHFNNIEVKDNNIFLTSRLTSSLLEISRGEPKATLRTICWDTPVMIHDGKLFSDNSFGFTSVDGKLLLVNKPGFVDPTLTSMQESAFHYLMKRDLLCRSIRLGDILGRSINWCRGIEEVGDYLVTTLDGRYDQAMPYFSVGFLHRPTSTLDLVPVNYSIVEFGEALRYMTGFSVLEVQ